MHPNPIFHDQTAQNNIAIARDRGFGMLAVNGGTGPVMAHVPFVIDEDAANLHLHLVRSNPIARALKSAMPACLVVNGADGYVSPDWYEIPDQVPTWNYVAVHLTGSLELRPQKELRALLDRQSAHFEDRLAPKTPWTADKMTPDVLQMMMRQIVPCRMKIEDVDGTWKLNQNKPDEVRLRAADYMDAYGMGSEVRILAALMRGTRGQS